jgi:hypothetical protein
MEDGGLPHLLKTPIRVRVSFPMPTTIVTLRNNL